MIDDRIVKVMRSSDFFRNSIATPSLMAAIITGKYKNHLPPGTAVPLL